MAGITGTVREARDNRKYVGLFEAEVIAINPNLEELREILDGAPVKDEPNYFTEKDGVKGLRISIWLKDVNTHKVFNKIIWLEDQPVAPASTGTLQYMNIKGNTLYCTSIDDLPEYMKPGAHRSKVGEAALADFVKSWLKLDTYAEDFQLDLEWTKLMQGKITGLTKFLNTDVTRTTTELAYVKPNETDKGTFMKQELYTKRFLPGGMLKHIFAGNYDNPQVIAALREKKARNEADRRDKANKLSPVEQYVLQIVDLQYGLEHFYGGFKPLREYNPNENAVSQDAAVLPENNNSGGFRY